MAYLASIARVGIPLAVVALLSPACGGRSFEGGGGEGATGAEPAGGSHSLGGSSSSGGKASAGTTSKAGSGPVGGSGAGGSSWGPECALPPEAGNCNAYFPAWFHDPSSGLCRPFAYGGCGGNANRYDSLEACQKACSGGQPNYDSCTQPTECAVGGGGCCGLCDSPGITAHDLIAYNRKYAREVTACDGTDIACAPCALPEPGRGSLQYFVPTCLQQQCAIVDIRQSIVTACKADTDCGVRLGTGCCQACGGASPIAVRNDGSFEELVCGSVPQSCPDCASIPPEGLIAVCGASGHCELAYVFTE